MGRKTFEGIGKPLPGRLNIVVTRDRAWSRDGVEVAGSLDEAIRLATVRARCMSGVDEIAIIGGGEIYAQAMPIADRLCITHVLAEPAGDTRFPAIDPAVWRARECEDHPAGERDSHATRYCVYERK
jgi:dihydrofolate reductase